MVIKQTNSPQTQNYYERVYWNSNSYGNATRINKTFILSLITVVCLITPFTNWMIPIAYKTIKDDMVIRYD